MIIYKLRKSGYCILKLVFTKILKKADQLEQISKLKVNTICLGILFFVWKVTTSKK